MKFLMKKENYFFLSLTVMLFAFAALAQDAVVANPTWLDGITKWAADHPVTSLSSILGFVLEILFRFVPTQKAMSILIPVRYVLVGAIAIFQWIADLVQVAIVAGNNVAKPPQN